MIDFDKGLSPIMRQTVSKNTDQDQRYIDATVRLNQTVVLEPWELYLI